MIEVRDLARQVLLEQARSSGRLATGVLMTAVEFAQAVPAAPAESASDRLVLCGKLHPACFDAVAADDAAMWHLTFTFASPAGVGYVVFVQQVGQWQHRLAVQLAPGELHTFERQLSDRPPRLFLRDGRGRSALLVDEAQAWPAPARDSLREAAPATEAGDLGLDIAASIAHLLEPEAVVDFSLEVAKDVCVSLVPSARLSLELGNAGKAWADGHR